MTNSISAYDESNDRLDQVLVEYLRSVEAGAPLDHEALVDKHPDLADDLRSFFANRDALERFARPLAGQARFDEPTLGPGESADLSRRLRYFGEYELMEEIARGGMGVVYKARQVKLNRTVAVKMILAGQLAGEDAVKRFYTEARAAAGLHHPNIVAIHEVGEHQGQHYFSMDYVDGESLAARIARGPLRAREAAELLQKVANAISFAHVENVIHRDLKPANVLLDREGEPHVSDFGLAKHTAKSEDAADQSLTATGQVLGTPSYMPPEQAAGKSATIGPHSDVYSLGAILYCMLTGRPPFQAASAMDTLMQVLQSEPVSPRSLNQAVPVDLNTICLKCLEKDPVRRYTSAAEFVEELERFLRGEPIRARPLGLLENTWRRLRRHQRILQSVGATIVTTILVAALAYLVWDWQREQRIGRLTLKTDGLPLSAELRRLDAGSSSLAFTIPTEQPLRLAGGEYRLRTTGAGMLSQDFTVSVDAGRESTFAVDLTEDRLWAPLRLEPNERADFVTIGNRTDVMLFENRFQLSALRRLDGSTLRPVWTLPIDSGQIPPPGLDPALLSLWSDLAQPWRWNNHRPLWIGLDKSIDGDPQADLIACWPTHDDLPFIAFSGADGTIRWIKSTTGQFDRLAARPLVTDVDSDPAPDLVRLGYRYGQGNLWIEAVSGGSGKTVWRKDLPLLAPLNPSDAKQGVYVWGKEYLFPCEIAKAMLAGDPIVVALTPNQMMLVRLSDGEQVGAPLAFGGPLAARPQVVDLNSAGSHELFWQTTSANSSDGSTSGIDAHLQCLGALDAPRVSLKSESTASQQRLTSLAGRNWGRITDLDHDGKHELLVPREFRHQPGAPQSAELAIRMYDATTGQQRWNHTVYPHEGATCDELLITPDVNDDGCDDVVVISSGPSEADLWNGSATLFIDLLDGGSGKRLATWNDITVRNDLGGFASNRRFESARWWGVDARGFPQLVLATIDETAPRNRRRLHIISPLEGRESHRLDDVGSWQLPDLDGDGLDDLLVSRESPDGQQIQAFRTKSPVAWRRLGTLQTAQDFDHDGIAEYLEVDYQNGRVVKVLGATDGRLLRTIHPVWTTRELRAPLQVFTWTAPLGNLGGDGTADLVLAGEYHLNPLNASARTATLPFPLQAIDGGTGKVLWREPRWSLPASMLDRTPQGAYVVGIEVRGEDLDADGRLELLVAYRLEWGESAWSGMNGQLWLAVIDSSNGTFLWQRSVGDIRKLPSAIGSDELPWFVAPEVLDLDGDGTRDLVLTVPRHQTDDTYPQGPFQFDIEAVSGRDGKSLWSPHRLATALSNIRHSDPMTARLPAVTVAVLAPGQRPSIVVAETILDPLKFDAAATTRTCRVTALRGNDGSGAWRFDWQSGGSPNEHNASQINIATMDIEGKGKLAIVAREYDQAPNDGGDALTWLTYRGELIRRTIADKSWAYQPASTRLWPIDVDDDGQAELALTRGGRIRLQRPDGSSVWPDSLERFGEVIAVESSPEQKQLIVVDGAGYSAIDAQTGQVKWRCEMGSPSVSPPRETRLVPSATRDGLPGILAVGQDSLLRVALRVDESGHYQPSFRDTEIAATPFDSRFVRRLPWDYSGRADSRLGLAALCGFALIVVPLGAVYLAVRRGRWSLKSWLMAPALVSYVIVATNLLTRLGDGQAVPPTLGQVWTLATSGTFALVFPALVVRWSCRHQWARLAALLVGSLGLALLFGGIGYVNAVHRLGPGESFRWTWTPLLNLWLPAAVISGWIGAIATIVFRVAKRRELRVATATTSSPTWLIARCGVGAVALLAGTAAMLGAIFVAYRARDMALPLVPFAIWCVVALGSLAFGVWCIRGLGRSQPGVLWIYVAVATGGMIGAVIAVFATDAGIEAMSNTTYQLSMRIWGRTIRLTRGELESLEPAMLVLGVGLGWAHVLAGGILGALAGGLAHRKWKNRRIKAQEQ